MNLLAVYWAYCCLLLYHDSLLLVQFNVFVASSDCPIRVHRILAIEEQRNLSAWFFFALTRARSATGHPENARRAAITVRRVGAERRRCSVPKKKQRKRATSRRKKLVWNPAFYALPCDLYNRRVHDQNGRHKITAHACEPYRRRCSAENSTNTVCAERGRNEWTSKLQLMLPRK